MIKRIDCLLSGNWFTPAGLEIMCRVDEDAGSEIEATEHGGPTLLGDEIAAVLRPAAVHPDPTLSDHSGLGALVYPAQKEDLASQSTERTVRLAFAIDFLQPTITVGKQHRALPLAIRICPLE